MVASKEYKENYIQSLDVLDDYPEDWIPIILKARRAHLRVQYAC